MTTAIGVPPLLSAEEFARLHGGDYVELIDGVVRELPMPKIPHGKVCNQFAFFLTAYVKAHRPGTICINDTFVLVKRNPDRVRGADIVYWSYDRFPKTDDVPDLVEVPAELIVEVRSPTDKWSDILLKIGEYLDAGTDVVVLLDPSMAAATVYRQNENQQIFHNGDVFDLPDILPGFAVPVSEFFS